MSCCICALIGFVVSNMFFGNVMVADKIYGMFYSAFRQETWWWEGTVAARKIIIALIGVFGAEMKSMQVHLTAMLVFLITLVTAQVRPFGGLKHGLLHKLEVYSLMATFLTLWAGSVFNTFPRCQDPLKGEGSTLPWCDALSVVVGSIDITVVVAFVVCFVYLKVESTKENEEEVNQQHPESLDEVGIEMTAPNAFVNPFYTNSPEEKSSARPDDGRVLHLVLKNPTNEKTKKNKEKRNMRMKKVRKKLSIGARVKRNAAVDTIGGEVKDHSGDETEEEQGDENGEVKEQVKKQKRKSFRKIEGDVRGEYFVDVDTGDSVWNLPKDGEVVF